MTRGEAERLLALAGEADFLGPDAEKWVERLSLERENLEEAVRWFAGEGEEESAAQLAANVWRLWFVTGDLAGGRQLLAHGSIVAQATTNDRRPTIVKGVLAVVRTSQSTLYNRQLC